MGRVPSSGATMVSEVSGVEDWDPRNAKSDGAVVRMTAAISASDSVQGGLDAAEILFQSRVDGSDTYGRSDLATVSLTAALSSADGLVFTDAATMTLTAVPSATEFRSVVYTDTATALHTSDVAGADVAAFSDSAQALVLARIYNLIEEATVTMLSREVEQDDTHQSVDSAITTLTAVPSPTWEVHENIDAGGTAILAAVITSLDEHTIFDSGTGLLIGLPSGSDFRAHWYQDSANALLTAVPSATEFKAHNYTDADIALLTGVPSGTDVLGHLIDMKFFSTSASGATGDGHTLTASLNGGAALAGDILVVHCVSASGVVAVVTDNVSGSTGWNKIGDSVAVATTLETTKHWKLCVGGETSVGADYGTPGNGRAFVAVICRRMGLLNEAYVINEGLAGVHFSEMEYGDGDGQGTSIVPSSDGEVYIGCTAIASVNWDLAQLGGVGVHDNNHVDGFGENTGGSAVGFGCIMHINDDSTAHFTTDTIRYESHPNNETFDSIIGIRAV